MMSTGINRFEAPISKRRAASATASSKPAISAFPPVVEFHGVEINTIYRIDVSIQNNDSKSRRIRIIPPKSQQFRCEFQPATAIAPGLDLTARVEFQTKEATNVHDVLTIVSENQRIEVPLHSFFPAPDIVFDGFVNLGAVVLDNTAAKYVTFTNMGYDDGEFRIVYDQESPVSISPDYGRLDAVGRHITLDGDHSPEYEMALQQAKAKCSQRVKVEFRAEALGVFRSVATVELPGFPSKVLDISATVVEQRLELLLPGDGGPVSHLPFGTLFFGQNRVIETTLVNHGPQACAFSLSMAQSFAGKMPMASGLEQDSETMAGSADSRDAGDSRRKAKAKEDPIPVQVLPAEGVVQPYGKATITLRYTPVDHEKPPAFKVLQDAAARERALAMGTGKGGLGADGESDGDEDEEGKRDGVGSSGVSVASVGSEMTTTRPTNRPPSRVFGGGSNKPLQAQTKLVVQETGQEIVFDMSGRGVKPLLDVSHRALPFGQCAVHDRRDIAITLSNRGDSLPIDWRINKIANFRTTPDHGTLAPMQTVEVIVSFMPSQLGKFSSMMQVSAVGGLKTIPLRVTGEAAVMGQKQTTMRTKDAPPSDFKPTYNFVYPSDSMGSTAQSTPGVGPDGSVMEMSTMDGGGSQPYTGGLQVGSSVVGPGGSLSSSKFQRPLPWEEQLDRGDSMSVNSRPEYTYSIETLQDQRDHKAKYTNFVRTQRRNRIQKQRELANQKAEQPWDDPVSLGLNPRYGLPEPKLKAPVADEPLWMERRFDEDGKPIIEGGREVKFDPNKLIKKKFKSKPSTQAEMRDCGTELTAEQLAAVHSGPKSIDFGTVCVGSRTTRSFGICNDLAQAILVELRADQPEISVHPKAQVIPAGATAGFDVQFIPSEPQEFRYAVTYVVNGQHILKFLTLASVQPVTVNLSAKDLLFLFPEDSTDFEVRREVSIRNPGDADANIRWQCVEADELAMGGGMARAATVSGMSGPGSVITAGGGGGDGQTVMTHGGAGNAGGTMSLASTAVFDQEPLPMLASMDQSFRIEPAGASIPPGSTLRCAITWRPGHHSAEKVGWRLLVENGDDAIAPPVIECKTVVEETVLEFSEKKIDFGNISIGLPDERQLFLENKGNAPGIFVFAPPPACITVEPMMGRVFAGESIEVQIKMKAPRPMRYSERDTSLKVAVRASAAISLPVAANAMIPDVEIEQLEIAFGGVTIGGRFRQRVSIRNKGVIPAILLVDLTQHPQFSLAMPNLVRAHTS